jgi:hypothetical protein
VAGNRDIKAITRGNPLREMICVKMLAKSTSCCISAEVADTAMLGVDLVATVMSEPDKSVVVMITYRQKTQYRGTSLPPSGFSSFLSSLGGSSDLRKKDQMLAAL